MTSKKFGTSKHQAMLATIVDHYTDDDRILAVLLFGSLSRGNWDQYSDLDLDIVLTDDVPIDAIGELDTLCRFIKKQHDLDAIIIADSEEGDVVLSNLIEFSIRYHHLHDTKPAIIESMSLLSGHITLDQIRAAAEVRATEAPLSPSQMIDQCIRYTLELHNAIARQRFWMATEFLHRIRSLLMQLFTLTHGGYRTIHHFEQHAPQQLSSQLVQLIPQNDLPSMINAFNVLLDLLENHLHNFSNAQYTLSDMQRFILQQIRSHSKII